MHGPLGDTLSSTFIPFVHIEPDLWYRRNITISAEQLAKDHEYLRKVLKGYKKENTMLFGPDVASLYSDHDFLTRCVL